MIDILLLVVFAVLTYLIGGEGAWGAAITLLCVVFSGLVAMNFFEPIAILLSSMFPDIRDFLDFGSLVGLFAVSVLLMRAGTDNISPTHVQVHAYVYEGLRWICGAAAAYVTMAFLLTALHTAPLPREFLGFTPERKNLLGFAAPDRQWLAFTQYVSEKSLKTGGMGRVFDAPRYQAPGTTAPRIWTSFPIRYATRREDYKRTTPRAPAATVPAGGEGTQPTAPAAI